MSCLLADHPDSAPVIYVDVFGQVFTYKPGSAEQASDWSDDDDE